MLKIYFRRFDTDFRRNFPSGHLGEPLEADQKVMGVDLEVTVVGHDNPGLSLHLEFIICARDAFPVFGDFDLNNLFQVYNALQKKWGFASL